MFSLTSRMLGRGDQQDRGGGGWGLPGLDLLQASLRGPAAGGVTGAANGNRTGGVAGQKGLLFGYFRQGCSGDDGGSSSSSSSSRRSGSKERGGSNGKSMPSSSSRSSMTAAEVAAGWLTKEENYVDLVLEERLHLELETVLGRLVLKSIEEGRAGLLPDVPPGSTLCSVDGESLRVDNLDRLMAKVALWTDVSDGLVGPPQPLKEDGEEQQQPVGAGGDDDDDAPTVPPPPSLHLTFRLLSTIPVDIDYQDLFPLAVVHTGGVHQPQATEETEEELAHQQLIAAFKSRLVEEEEEDEKDDGEGISAAVAPPTDEIIEHYLGLGEWELEKGLGEFVAVREEARELLAAHAVAAASASGGGGEGGREGGQQQQQQQQQQRLVWDPAVEEPQGLEEFPSFEAVEGEEEGEGEDGGSQAAAAAAAEYEVVVTEQEVKLGITVENVLERTVICTVSRTSSAFRAGMEEGCLLIALGESSTAAMCHKEVIDRLMQMHRPLRLTLRRLPPERLQQRRAEMVALVHADGTPGPDTTAAAAAAGGGGGGGGVGGWDASVESRGQVVGWAEEKMLGLLRLLVVGSLLRPSRLRPSEPEESSSLLGPVRRQGQGLGLLSSFSRSIADAKDEEVGHALASSLRAGAAASSMNDDDGRLEQWQGRLLEIASSIQSDLQHARAHIHTARQRLTALGVNERLKTLGGHLQTLLELVLGEDVGGCVWWEQEEPPVVVAALRWQVIDLIVQLLCVDMDGSLSVSRDSRDLVEGPAITLLQELVSHLPLTQIQSNVTMLLYRLAGSSSSHARVACAALAPCVYGRLPPAQQLQLRGLLMRLLGEESALIRSVVVEALAELTPMMDCHSVKWLYLMLDASARDGSPRIRTKILQICYSLAQALHRAAITYSLRPTVLQELHLNRCKLLPFVNSASEDPDWQVRAAFAYFCPGFVDCFGTHWDDVFLDNLETLMRDDELAVRKLAVDSITKIAEAWLARGGSSGGVAGAGGGGGEQQEENVSVSRGLVKQRVLEHLLPGFIRLISDSSVQVRASVAAATGRLLHLLTQTQHSTQQAVPAAAPVDGALVELMTPLMQRILHDEAPAQVALALLQGMRMDESVLYYGVGLGEDEDGREDEATRSSSTSTKEGSIPLALVESQVDLLLPAVIFLASHSSWRLRQGVVEALPLFQLLVGPGHKYDASLQELWQELLLDGVEIVRRAAAAHFILIGKVMGRYPQHGGGRGRGWLEERVIPCVQECLESPAFKQRQLGLHMVEILLREDCLIQCENSATLIQRELWPLILKRLNDPLANVRLVAASVLEHSFRALPKRLWDSEEAPLVVEIVRLCREDGDRDVRLFAGRVAGRLGVDVEEEG